MSRFSHEHHLQAPQEDVINSLYAHCALRGADVEDVTLPADEAERAALSAMPFEAEVERFIVGPTDATGWSILFSERGLDDEGLLADISEFQSCRALYGHNNDQTDNWRWQMLEQGRTLGEYWYVGQAWVRLPEHHPRPEGALTIYEAFEAWGRTYHHLPFEHVLMAGDRHFELPITRFQLVTCRFR